MVRDEAYYNSITEVIIGSAYKVANRLGTGFLEKVYENALAHETAKAGLDVRQQHPIKVFYEDVLVGEYFADLLVQDDVLVELKAIKRLDEGHFAQCMNYLKGTGKRIGLLINFGSPKVQIRRVVNSTEFEWNAEKTG